MRNIIKNFLIVIEHEFISTYTEEKLKNFHYYLAVLNADYIFDGTYVDGKPVYNVDDNGNELITFFDMTKVTEDYQKYVDADRRKLEIYLENLDASETPLGDSCGFKKQSGCKYFSPVCGSMIPAKNSSLNYIHNGFGFVKDDGTRIKGLELINEGYINLMDIPDSWIHKKNHQLQRDCY